jgi:uncharacterized membrane protein YfcA
MSIEIILYLFFAGVLCGAINAVAGGATLIGFPVLMSVGLPPSVANASNFLATLPGYAAAIPSYLEEIRHLKNSIKPILVVSVIGGMLGSVILLISPSAIFVKLTPYLLLTATLLYAFGGSLNRLAAYSFKGKCLKQSVFGKVLVGIFSLYGGYFGAGLGIIILCVLKVLGYHDYHDSNAIKNIMITLISVLSILIFIAGGLVSWPESLIMMSGATIGGYCAAKYAKNISQFYLKKAIILIGLSFSGYYFYSA